jgi:hypothetical protein
MDSLSVHLPVCDVGSETKLFQIFIKFATEFSL